MDLLKVVHMFYLQGSRDNMSIEIITFEAGCPKVSEEAQKREAELDARIEGLIKGKKLACRL